MLAWCAYAPACRQADMSIKDCFLFEQGIGKTEEHMSFAANLLL
jgi:hypothetical protein